MLNTQTHIHIYNTQNLHKSVFFPGFLYENSTADMRFAFTGLTPYTRYTVGVQARAAGELGPAAEEVVITPAEGEDIKLVYSQMPVNPSLTANIAK